ncbi:MAG: diguanylate cyclase, partial [Nitrospinota bacterium]|nr:diguanylate cyclase [Nitrospinota bacterium]
MAREEARTRQGAQPQKEAGGFTDTLSNVKIADLEQQEAKKAEPANLGKSPELERRHDPLRVKPIDEMNLEEAREALRTSELTGLLSKRAYLEDMGISRLEGEEVNKEPGGVVVAVDADSMKYLNDNFGHSFGDQYLRMIGSAMREGKGNGRAYHLSGDEFAMRFDTEADANAAIESVQNNIRGRILEASHENGQTVRLEGVTLSVATGKSHGEADARLNEIKQRRTASGERAGRGEKPAWASVRQNESGRTGHDRPAGGTAQKGGGRGQPDSVPPVGEEGGVARQQEGSAKPLPPFTKEVPKTPPPPAVSNPETPAAPKQSTPPPRSVPPTMNYNRAALKSVESRQYTSRRAAQKFIKELIHQGYAAGDFHIDELRNGAFRVYPSKGALAKASRPTYQAMVRQGRKMTKGLAETEKSLEAEFQDLEMVLAATKKMKVKPRDYVRNMDLAGREFSRNVVKLADLMEEPQKFEKALEAYVSYARNKSKAEALERAANRKIRFKLTPRQTGFDFADWVDRQEQLGLFDDLAQESGEKESPAPELKAEPHSEKKKEVPAPARNIVHEDVGEKIGGARKDVWAGR